MAEVAYLVLAEETDEVAQWARHGLQRRLAGEVALVTPADLAFADELTYVWDGRAERSRVTLDDGRVLDGARVRGVLNRFTTVYTDHWRRLGSQDATYAEAEIHAALLAWLDSLGDVVTNPPTPYWLGGPYLRPQVWRAQAARVGIPVAPVRESAGTLAVEPDGTVQDRTVPDGTVPDGTVPDGTVPDGTVPDGTDVEQPYVDEGLTDALAGLTSLRRVVMHRGQAFGDASVTLAAWGRALADQVGVPLLGLDVARTEDGAEVLADVTVHPDLRLGGEPLLASVAHRWREERAA
jgi:hypothetical protein